MILILRRQGMAGRVGAGSVLTALPGSLGIGAAVIEVIPMSE